MANDPQSYDFIILGGGPAGINAATVFGDHGKRVAVVDNHRELGGAGINTGTIPSKTLRETALALSGLRSRDLYGVDLSLQREVTVGDFLGHEQHIRDAFNHSLARRLEEHKADVYEGLAAFTDPHTVEITPLSDEGSGKKLLRAETILLTTGSSPVRPGLFPFGQGDVYDSDTILSLHRIPKKMAVVGSGVIGCEYACIFAALEAEIHIVDSHDTLLPFLDHEVSQALLNSMQKSGVVFHWNEKVEKCWSEQSGSVTLQLASGSSLTLDAVLVAAGRQSNTGSLNLTAAGVKTGERGVVPVDKEYRTNVPHIYAAGDIIGYPALASTSIVQGRLAARHALGLQAETLPHLLPSGIYTIPEISMVGETEETLKKQGVAYVVGRARYEDNGRGRIIGEMDGFLKLLFRREDMKLVGVHVIGEQGTEIVHIGLIAMLTGSKADLLVQMCFNVPTLGLLYRSAALDALSQVAAA